MNQPNQENGPDADPPSIPEKRKRGRPRKDRSLNLVESVHVPPGFKGVNGNHPRQVDPIDDPKDDMVGQAVTGVVEVAFDAGYLLRVRIGNSNSYLRGVVFKPGHYVPISAQNDIAPHVEMIRRNDTHRSAENQTRVRGRNRRTRERNNENSLILNGSPPADQALRLAPRTASLVASKGKHVYSVAAPSVPLVGSRGTVVPVILQPVSLSNGLQFSVHVPAVASQANHVPLKGKQVQTQDEIERVQPSSRSSEAHTEDSRAASKSSAKDSDHNTERVVADVNEPLLIEPLQAIRSDGRTAAKVLENNRAGRMTELLQAVQENMAENQEIQVENMSTDTRFESHEMKSPETDRRGEESVQSKKRSRASSD